MTDVQPLPPALIPSDERHAPLIFLDAAPFFVHYNGIVAITITALLHHSLSDGKVRVRDTVVGYLRMNVQGARSLRAALDKALLAAEPAPEGKAN